MSLRKVYKMMKNNIIQGAFTLGKRKDCEFSFYNYLSLLPQVKGIWLAAKECNTKYMIRTRSDASFSDLSKMIIRFSKHLDTVVSSNIIWRPAYNNRSFHMGDHCFISDAETIKKVYWDFYRFKNMRGNPTAACEEYLYYFFRKHNRIPCADQRL